MPVDQVTTTTTTASNDVLLFLSNFTFLYKIGFGALFVLYFIFALLVVRQVMLMTNTLYTDTSPVLHALAILHAGIALAILILFIGLF